MAMNEDARAEVLARLRMRLDRIEAMLAAHPVAPPEARDAGSPARKEPPANGDRRLRGSHRAQVSRRSSARR
jgi:hypothetical protein